MTTGNQKLLRLTLIFLSLLFLSFLVTCLSKSKLYGRTRNASLMATQTQIGMIYEELEATRKTTGRYPTEEEGIPKMVSHVQGLPKIYPKDAWGSPFRYRLVNGRPVVDSAGPDGLLDTADDINDRSPNYRLRNDLPYAITMVANLAFLVAFACWLKALIRRWRRPRVRDC